MYDRRFGVEIECGNHNGFDWVRRRLQQDRIPGVLSVGRDGSGVEVRTRPLRGNEGLRTLKTLMEYLVDLGCTTNRNDGLHVHHEVPELRGISNPDARAARIKLVRSWFNNQDTIRRFAANNRNMFACSLWTQYSVDNYERNGLPDGTRRALNVCSIGEHGTIELRLHEGTLDFGKTEAWVKFGQYFISDALKRAHPIPQVDDAATLLRRIRAPKAAQVAYGGI